MSVLITLITGAILAAPLVALIVAWRRLHVRLRTRGCGRLQIAAVFSVLLVACYATVAGLVGASAGADAAAPAGGRAVLIFFVPPLLWIVLAAAIARIVSPRLVPPRRAERVSGRRRSRIPYRVLGWSTTAAGLGMAAFFVWQFFFGDIVPRREVVRGLLGTLMVLGLGEYWRILGRRLKDAPVVLPEIKGSVLYLRAFGDENRPFVTGPASKLGRYTDQLVSKTAVRRSRQDPTIRLTLEDYLGEAIVAQLGPFVALGNPIDSLPPDGAIREYAPDGAWQERFTHLSQDARCIVIALSESENLQWELQWISQSRMSQKLCLFTPPRPPRKNEFGAHLKALHENVSQRTSLASTWASAVDALQRAGYACDPACPGPGAAIAFDEAGTSVLLTTEASTPTDYVTPVADWLNTRTKTGKCVPASCTSCQTTIYRSPNDSPAAGESLCFKCQGEAKLADMSMLDRALERRPWLFYVWFTFSLFFAAWLAVSLSIKATWLGILLFVLVLASPWIAVSGFRWARRASSKKV